jgi:hypothetical protein
MTSRKKALPVDPGELFGDHFHERKLLFRKHLKLMTMRKMLLCLLGTCLLGIMHAQQKDPSVLSAAGNTAKGAGITLDWTLGELAVATVTTSEGLLTQGFHQPMLIVEESVELPTIKLEDGIQFSIAPNPVSSSLTIRLDSQREGEGELALWDARGQRLKRAAVDLSLAQQEWDLGSYASGIYTVTLRDEKGALLRSYKISKIN